MIINLNEENIIVCGNRGNVLTLAFVAKDKLPQPPEGDLTPEYMDQAFNACDEHGASINFTTVDQINYVFSAVAGELKKREETAQ
jgi:hypothetical protein